MFLVRSRFLNIFSRGQKRTYSWLLTSVIRTQKYLAAKYKLFILLLKYALLGLMKVMKYNMTTIMLHEPKMKI